MDRLARTLGLAALLAGAAWSCASVLDVDHDYFARADAGADATQGVDGGPPADATSKDATQPGDTASSPPDGEPPDDAGADTSSPVPPVDAGPPCALQSVNASQGVFVTTYGMDNGTCAIGTPCLTVQAGIQAARVNGMPTVYVANGVYTENDVLYPGVTLMGGWNALGPTWTPVCTGNRSSVATIQAPAASTQATLTATNLTGLPTTVSTLTIKSVPQSAVAPGQSLFGIVATGASTQLALVDVDVVMANAGNGVPGDAGAPGGNACGSGAVEDGGAAEDGGVVGMEGVPSAGGMYAQSGYAPGAGAAGTAGGNGIDGPVISVQTCTGCISSCTCLGTCTTSSPCESVPGSSCGTPGTPSCAGVGGQGGLGGTGGGSSIALFVWDATVTVSGGSLTAGNGGAGGSGGPGGPGGPAQPGGTGDPGPLCGTACEKFLTTCEVTGATHGAAGSVGPGTAGGVGGQGGGGAGGSSFAVYAGGAASVMGLPSASVTLGTAGPGGMPSGASGTANPQGP